MTTQKLLKRRVRERVAKTGERYTAARRHIVEGRQRPAAAEAQLASAKELASDERLSQSTGRDWQSWLSLLDDWGARDRKHSQIVEFLMQDQAVPGWWAQTITTGYERARGMRLKHQQSSGFTIYASRTVAVTLDALFAAFTDEDTRAQWLSDGTLSLRTLQHGKVARFDWDDGSTRVLVTFEAKGPTKSTAHVAHERLPDAAGAEVAKRLWKDRLAGLKAFLESAPPTG